MSIKIKKEDVLIRGTRTGLQIVLNDETDFQSAKKSLAERLAESGSFFQGAQVTLDLGARMLGPAELVEIEELMCDRFGIHLGRIVHTCNDAGPRQRRPTVREARETVEEREPALEPDEGKRPTVLVKRTIRSGQVVKYDGNVVVLGDVNPGSQVISSGDIVVVGAMLGVAHAGASGDRTAIVAALRLAPTQLRIAGRIARPPDGAAGPHRPEVARLDDEGIVVEKMSWVTWGDS